MTSSNQNSIPKQMKAARITDFKKPMSCDNIDVPADLKDHEILVQIKAAGMCHTDLQVLEGVYEAQGAHSGMVGSHEPAGIVVKLGPKAEKDGKVKIGDRVGSINTFGYCGDCASCRQQGQQLCDNIKGLLGLTINGGFSEYMKADSRVVGKIPDDIDFASAAPLFCAGATIYGGLLAADVKPGQVIAIIGIGGLGSLGVQYAKAMGLKVIAIDNRQEGLDVLKNLPKNLQPDETCLIGSEEAQKKTVEKLGNGFYDSNPGVDRIVIATEDRKLVKFGQQFLRKGGVMVDLGLPADGPLEVDSFALNFKEQTIKGRLICTPAQSQEMINFHSKHGCVTHIEKTYPVEQINELIDHYKSKKLQGRLVMVF